MLIVSGMVLIVWGIASLGFWNFAGTGQSLKRDGLYAYTRNPQYLGMILANIGLIVYFRSILVLILGVVACLGLLYVPRVEEDYLQMEFGDEYRAYREDTPCFLGWSSSSGRD